LPSAGCEVTVFDKQPVIGGLLASGVPPFKLDKALLLRRHQLLEQQGVHFRLGVEVDEALLQELLRTRDAIFLGTGTQTSRDLQLPGQQLTGVTDALSYLQQVNRDPEPAVMADKQVLVIGAGDSAMDCARSAVRQGAAEVTVAYRREEQAMRASPKEKQAAFEEGVFFRMERAPAHVLGDEAVTGVRFNTPDGGQETIACDVVILAVGQVCRPPAWLLRLGVESNAEGVIQIDAHGRTSHPRIYAGGDSTHGPDLVVTAIAAGRRAAEGILDSFRLSRRATQAATALFNPGQTTGERVPLAATVIQQESVP
jgi:glutamate synthase (NADPH/NADH) small chain